MAPSFDVVNRILGLGDKKGEIWTRNAVSPSCMSII